MGRPRAGSVVVATPERLLAAAEDAFARAGFAAARLEDVAAGAGIGRASLLHHFGSKEQLYGAVVARVFADLGAALVAAMRSQGAFEDRLTGLVTTFADFVDERPALAAIVVRELLDGRGPGRDILLGQVAPLLGEVERFVRAEGRRTVRPGLHVRAALMQVCSDVLLRAAAGPLRAPLWGEADHAAALARMLFLDATPPRRPVSRIRKKETAR